MYWLINLCLLIPLIKIAIYILPPLKWSVHYTFIPPPSHFLISSYLLRTPIIRIPDSQKSSVVKMIKTWSHRFAVKISLRWKGIVQLSYRQPRICMLPQVLEQVFFRTFSSAGNALRSTQLTESGARWCLFDKPIIFLNSCSVVVLCFTCAGSHLEEK